MTTLLCGATFQGLESARQTAPTKRKVYEDFTTTLMRRRENRVWSSYRKRRREPSWGKKNADERYSCGFVCVVVSLHHPRQGFTIRAIHPQVWQRAQTVLSYGGNSAGGLNSASSASVQSQQGGDGISGIEKFAQAARREHNARAAAPSRQRAPACGGQAQDEPPHPKSSGVFGDVLEEPVGDFECVFGAVEIGRGDFVVKGSLHAFL